MLFLKYWKLNEDISVEQRQEVAQRLTSSGLFPPEDVEIIRWDGTPDGWGIVLAEAESADAIGKTIDMWRVAGDGFFEKTVTAPAQPVQKALEGTQELLDAVSPQTDRILISSYYLSYDGTTNREEELETPDNLPTKAGIRNDPTE